MSLQVELLEKSFEAVKPQANEFANSFYENLFTTYPEAKPLFIHTNMAEQKKKLLGSLVLIVENLRIPDILSDSLRGLGARHVKYGALPEHYPLVGNSLLMTFEQYLKEQWTPEVKQAWVEAYGAITEIMLDGADYSQAEIALEPPLTDNTEQAKSGLQVELLEKSFEEVKPQADEFVNSFYENLFTTYPEAKPLFTHSNMAEQKKKLLASLVLVVENLKKPEVLGDSLRGLGARHVKYGALPEHYPLVGNSLLMTFGQYLKEKWTPEVKQAWVEAYGAITEIMLDGADYSQAEIALKTPTTSETSSEAKQSNLPIELNEREITMLNSRSSNIGNDGVATANQNSNAGTFALLGGGIAGIIALLLIIL